MYIMPSCQLSLIWNCEWMVRLESADLFPGSGRVGFSGAIDGCLVLAQVHEGGGETSEVWNVVEEQFGCFVQAVVEASVTHLKYTIQIASSKISMTACQRVNDNHITCLRNWQHYGENVQTYWLEIKNKFLNLEFQE